MNSIYKNYEGAMNKRRPGCALDEQSFLAYIARDDVKTIELNDSMVFGKEMDGIFFPSHFAPAGLKGGIDLVKKLQKQETVFAVTEDLAKMLAKLGYVKCATKTFEFCGEPCEKIIMASNRKVFVKAAIAFAKAEKEKLAEEKMRAEWKKAALERAALSHSRREII